MAKAKPKPSWETWQRKRITPEFCDELSKLIAEGATLKQAGRVVGVPAGILRRWLMKGAEQVYEIYESDELTGPPDLEGMLYTAVEQAYGRRGRDLLMEIRKADKDSEWRARAWLLERLEADEFGDRTQVDVDVHTSGKVQLGVVTVDVLRVLEEAGVTLGAAKAAEPQRALPAPVEVLAEPDVGEPATDRVSAA